MIWAPLRVAVAMPVTSSTRPMGARPLSQFRLRVLRAVGARQDVDDVGREHGAVGRLQVGTLLRGEIVGDDELVAVVAKDQEVASRLLIFPAEEKLCVGNDDVARLGVERGFLARLN